MHQASNNERRIRRHAYGFTLFEIVLGIGIGAIIVLAVGRFGGTIGVIGTLIGNKLQSSQDLEAAFQGIVTDLRSMGPAATGAYPIEAASTGSITFYSDTDQDSQPERIRYFFATSSLEKGVIKPSGSPIGYPTSTEVVSTAVPNVTASGTVFEYFDGAYAGVATASLPLPIDLTAIRVIRVTLTGDVSTTTAPKPVTVRAVVTPRNLRSN